MASNYINIERETDQLIHAYVELSIAETTLKYLLDAKMHLFTAEHDLLVSHEVKDAEEELIKVLDYLNEAIQVSKPSIKVKVNAVINDVHKIKNAISTRKTLWKNENAIEAMGRALKIMTDAKENAPSEYKLRIKLIQVDIQKLRVEMGSNSIVNNYESAMAALKKVIHEL